MPTNAAKGVYPKIRITPTNPADPEPVEIIADAVKRIAEGIEAINRGALNQRAIVLLVANASGVGVTDTRAVLEGLASLRKYYLKADLK